MFVAGLAVGVAAGTIAGLFLWEKIDSLHWNKESRKMFYAKLPSINKTKKRKA